MYQRTKYYLKIKCICAGEFTFVNVRSNDYEKMWHKLESIDKNYSVRCLYMNVFDNITHKQIKNFTSKNPPPKPAS